MVAGVEFTKEVRGGIADYIFSEALLAPLLLHTLFFMALFPQVLFLHPPQSPFLLE